MSFGHALYYPHIELTNKNWVKHSFLFWDKITRIVPSSVDPSDSEDIIKIRYETGFIEDYSPDTWTVSDAFRSFSEFLEHYIHSGRFYGHYMRHRGLDNMQSEYRRHHRLLRDPGYRREAFRALTRRSGTFIHVQKLDHRLKEKLFDLGLALPADNEWEDWVQVDNEIGYIYMSYLAKVISKKMSLPIVTDMDEFYAASSLFDRKVYRDYDAEFEYRLGNLLIASFIPKDINKVPFDKLIEIREKYSAERTAFFNTVSNLCQNIPSIDNESALKDALNHYKSSLIEQTGQLKKAYEANKIETAARFLSISVPSTVLSLSSYIPVQYKPLGIGAGVLFGLATSINSAVKEKSQLREKPLSYLLNINSELSSKNLFKRINDSIMGLREW